MSNLSSTAQYFDTGTVGPLAQVVVNFAALGASAPPANVGATSTYTTPTLLAGGYASLAVAAKLAAAGNLTVQRYLDDAGTIPQGAASTVALTAGTLANLNIADGLPFKSYTISVQNTSAGAAALQTLFALLNAK